MDLEVSPNHSESLPLGDLSSQAFITLSFEAAKALDWHVEELDEAGYIAYTNFSATSWAEEVTVKVKNNNVIIESECSGKESCEWHKNRQNVEQLISKTSELKSSLTTEQLAIKTEALQEQVIASAGTRTAKKNKSLIHDFRALFVPVKGYFATPLLMIANIVILLVMSYLGGSIGIPEMEMMLNWGANTRQLILEGEAWRFLTSCFLHFGIMHLLMNMIALYYIGYLLEPRLGSGWFLLAYLTTGVCASMISTWWHAYGISAGASGCRFWDVRRLPVPAYHSLYREVGSKRTAGKHQHFYSVQSYRRTKPGN
jgi:rhomboid protease GluP